MMFRPSAMNIDDFEDTIKGGPSFVQSDFMNEYRYHLVSMQNIAYAAKVFLAKRWEEVKDWTKLDVIIRDNSKQKTEYYNYVPPPENIAKENAAIKKGNPEDSIIHRMFEQLEERQAKKHNPVQTVTNVCLDTSDGDFSLTINGKDHFWIDDQSVIVIAAYVEEQLAAQEKHS